MRTPTRGLSIFFEPMNRKQTWLTVGCFLLLCGAIVFSVRGIRFSDRGGFTAPQLNFAWLFVGNAAIAVAYPTLFLLLRKPKRWRL